MRKKKAKAQKPEKEHVRRLREKMKFLKELAKKREKFAAAERERKARFRLPPHQPRPDAIPFATAMRILRVWNCKADIFVRSTIARWSGETRVIAMVRVVPNCHQPKGLKGNLELPHPVASAKKEKKKETIAVISEQEKAEEARKAGMIVGGPEYLEQVCLFRKGL